MDVVVGQARKQLLGKAAQNIRQNRPVFETDPEIIRAIDEASMSQKKHWWKTNKVATPDIILSKNDRNILHKVKSRAWYLDKGFHCCCCNIGLDAIIGLIPGIGDVITTVMAMQLVRTAAKANLPGSLIVQMMWNVFLDFIVSFSFLYLFVFVP
jgi:hypothetical protein